MKTCTEYRLSEWCQLCINWWHHSLQSRRQSWHHCNSRFSVWDIEAIVPEMVLLVDVPHSTTTICATVSPCWLTGSPVGYLFHWADLIPCTRSRLTTRLVALNPLSIHMSDRKHRDATTLCARATYRRPRQIGSSGSLYERRFNHNKYG